MSLNDYIGNGFASENSTPVYRGKNFPVGTMFVGRLDDVYMQNKLFEKAGDKTVLTCIAKDGVNGEDNETGETRRCSECEYNTTYRSKLINELKQTDPMRAEALSKEWYGQNKTKPACSKIMCVKMTDQLGHEFTFETSGKDSKISKPEYTAMCVNLKDGDQWFGSNAHLKAFGNEVAAQGAKLDECTVLVRKIQLGQAAPVEFRLLSPRFQVITPNVVREISKFASLLDGEEKIMTDGVVDKDKVRDEITGGNVAYTCGDVEYLAERVKARIERKDVTV